MQIRPQSTGSVGIGLDSEYRRGEYWGGGEYRQENRREYRQENRDEYRQESRQAHGYGPGKLPAILITPVLEEPEVRDDTNPQ